MIRKLTKRDIYRETYDRLKREERASKNPTTPLLRATTVVLPGRSQGAFA